jgi:hypothetical protein
VWEGFPTSFLQAFANECALLSSVDQGGCVTILFDRFVGDDDFAPDLTDLLQIDAWRVKGWAGWEYVQRNFEMQAVIARYMEACRRVLASKR